MKRSTKDICAEVCSPSGRRPPRDEEHLLQCRCVRWFRLQYPRLAHALFAVPNGGRRDMVTGARLKEEGALAGVSDLILLRPNGQYCALLIEMKTPSGRQSTLQREWERLITQGGEYRYVVCRTLDEFVSEVSGYLGSSLCL